MVIIVFGFIGVILFALPANIFGTGLALKIQEERNRTEIYLNPAIKLIQSVWRCYASNKHSKTDVFWKVYERSDGKALTRKDRACIRFIRSIMYFKASHRFKLILEVQNDDYFNERNAIELLRRIESIKRDTDILISNVDRQDERKGDINKTIDKLNIKFDKIRTKYKNNDNIIANLK